jgi:branched-chain amino acid transport system ATP-binding protein
MGIRGIEPMPDPLLQVRALDAHYGDFQALFGVSMRVAEGEVVAVIGANGAGKSTLLQVHRRRDAVAPRRHPVSACRSAAAGARGVSRGIALVPEGRRLFPSLTSRKIC